MFADEFCNVLMQSEPKVETSSDAPLKSSVNFANLRKCSYGFEQHRIIFGDLLKIAQNATSCSNGEKLLETLKVA